jgi:hypothetical protein
MWSTSDPRDFLLLRLATPAENRIVNVNGGGQACDSSEDDYTRLDPISDET